MFRSRRRQQQCRDSLSGHAHREYLSWVNKCCGIRAELAEEIGGSEENEKRSRCRRRSRYEPECEERQCDHNEPPDGIDRRPMRSMVKAYSLSGQPTLTVPV
jgi:hypothetical protein